MRKAQDAALILAGVLIAAFLLNLVLTNGTTYTSAGPLPAHHYAISGEVKTPSCPNGRHLTHRDARAKSHSSGWQRNCDHVATLLPMFNGRIYRPGMRIHRPSGPRAFPA